MRNKFKDVDMEKVTKYMIAHGCRLDEAIEAVKKESGVPEAPDPTPAPVVETEKAVPKIKTMRIGSGMSQSQFAAAVGINVRTLQAYEQGYRSFDSVSIKVLLQTAIVLGCKIEDIIDDPVCIDLLEEYKK